MENWYEMIPPGEIRVKVTAKSVDFAQRFGNHLGTDERFTRDNGKPGTISKLSTSQLRRFFGEVKRQQMQGYDSSEFILLKPKLAYAVGRTEGKSKITDFYKVISKAMDSVTDENSFENFIKIFEAIVAYHKAAEEKKL